MHYFKKYCTLDICMQVFIKSYFYIFLRTSVTYRFVAVVCYLPRSSSSEATFYFFKTSFHLVSVVHP